MEGEEEVEPEETVALLQGLAYELPELRELRLVDVELVLPALEAGREGGEG